MSVSVPKENYENICLLLTSLIEKNVLDKLGVNECKKFLASKKKSTSGHSYPQKTCHKGVDCWNKLCQYSHPDGWDYKKTQKKCLYKDKCMKADCLFLHPKKVKIAEINDSDSDSDTSEVDYE